MVNLNVELNGKTILVTSSPSFIGANLVMRLLQDLTSGHIISFDNMNDYYDVSLKLSAGKKIQIFNYGNCKCDFTYVDDIVEGVVRVMQGHLKRKPAMTSCQSSVSCI